MRHKVVGRNACTVFNRDAVALDSVLRHGTVAHDSNIVGVSRTKRAGAGNTSDLHNNAVEINGAVVAYCNVGCRIGIDDQLVAFDRLAVVDHQVARIDLQVFKDSLRIGCLNNVTAFKRYLCGGSKRSVVRKRSFGKLKAVAAFNGKFAIVGQIARK